jgi:hypothetical protein
LIGAFVIVRITGAPSMQSCVLVSSPKSMSLLALPDFGVFGVGSWLTAAVVYLSVARACMLAGHSGVATRGTLPPPCLDRGCSQDPRKTGENL